MNSRRRRILVLDRDEQTLLDLQKTLEDVGFKTTTTWDAAEALALARTRQYDLLLVGDQPPEITGSEILRELQCSRVSVPCVILQGAGKSFDPDYYYSLGASGVISNWNVETVGQWLTERFSEHGARAG